MAFNFLNGMLYFFFFILCESCVNEMCILYRYIDIFYYMYVTYFTKHCNNYLICSNNRNATIRTVVFHKRSQRWYRVKRASQCWTSRRVYSSCRILILLRDLRQNSKPRMERRSRSGEQNGPLRVQRYSVGKL